MVKVLVNEILLSREINESEPPEKRKDLKFLESFLEKVLEKHPNLNDMTPESNLVDKLKTKSEETIAAKRKQLYESSFQRRKHNPKAQGNGNWRNNCPTDNTHDNNNQESFRQENRNTYWKNKQVAENNSGWDKRNRFSFSEGNDAKINRGYNRGDHRRQSESQSNWGRNRYDTTVTDWRSENKKQ